MTDTNTAQALYLLVFEERNNDFGQGYFHLRARVCTEGNDHGVSVPHGIRNDDYSSGLLYTDLTVNSQGDAQSRLRDREPLYGFDVDYRGVFSVDARKAERMAKTLKLIAKGQDKLTAQRGYVTSFGEYVGRVAEILKCVGIVYDEKGQPWQSMHSARYRWNTIGEGVNRINHAIYRWVQEAKEPKEQSA